MDTSSVFTNLPELPLEAWEASKRTLNLYCQIVGKVRLGLHPRLNHWWHATLYVSPRGLTTQAIPLKDGLIDLEFDLVDHLLVIRSTSGSKEVIKLENGLSVARFYEAVMTSLGKLGVHVNILAKPYDPDKVGSDIPFAEDDTNASYDPEFVTHYWHILTWIDAVFREFKGKFYGKSTPVHLFWHSFDLTYTRFSGKAAPLEGGSKVDKEAYSHEVISFGFWPGDSSVPAPAFYSYTYPEPEGLRTMPLRPSEATWVGDASAMAILMYDDVRQADSPKEALLEFLQSAYLAGATRANWDIAALEHV